MQALESLNDNQVNDFLSGKSPLNLSVRLGDHMMLIQLQLSTLSPSQQNSLKQKVANAALLKNQATSRLNLKRAAESPVETAHEQQVVENDATNQDDCMKSPIKSLSSMVSNPLTTTVENMNNNINKFWLPSADPIAGERSFRFIFKKIVLETTATDSAFSQLNIVLVQASQHKLQ